MRSVLTTFICLLITFGCVGKKISAKIVDKDSSEPLPYAMVKNVNRNAGALSDTTGMFRIEATDKDSVKITYVGYYDIVMSCSTLDNDSIVEMPKKEIELNEIVAVPSKKPKIKTFGKKHHAGMFMTDYEVNEGDSFGLSVNQKGKRTWLTEVGFYIEEYPKMLDSLKLQLNIYDITNVEKSPSDKFINILTEPIYINYDKSQVKDNKFTFTLSSPILLPEKAFIEFVFLETKEPRIYYKSNLLGSGEWIRSLDERYWLKAPFALPGFAKCKVYNK